MPSCRPSRAPNRSIRRWSNAAPTLLRARRCGSCHLPNLAGQQQIPRIARQRIDYLILTLKSYRDSLRSGADTAMSANIVGATDADIVALAHYAASL